MGLDLVDHTPHIRAVRLAFPGVGVRRYSCVGATTSAPTLPADALQCRSLCVSSHRRKPETAAGYILVLIRIASQQKCQDTVARLWRGPCVHFDAANVTPVVGLTTKSDGVCSPSTVAAVRHLRPLCQSKHQEALNQKNQLYGPTRLQRLINALPAVLPLD